MHNQPKGDLMVQISHPALELVNRFEVKVPQGFTLDACPGREKWHPVLTDANFRTSLKGGEGYIAEVYCVERAVGRGAIAALATSGGRVLPGAVGAAVLIVSYGENLPEGKRGIHSPDKSENLFQAGGIDAVPYFFREEDDSWGFITVPGMNNIPRGDYIILFTPSG